MKNKVVPIIFSLFLIIPVFAQEEAGFDDFAGSEVENEVLPEEPQAEAPQNTNNTTTNLNNTLSNEEAGEAVSAEEIVPIEDVPTQTATNNLPEEAEEQDDDIIIEQEDPAEIEVVTTEKYYLPYKQRRDKHGWSFALQMEQVEMTKYKSLTTATAIPGYSATTPARYNELYGNEAVTMPVLRVGYKYNMGIGSILLEGAYGVASISDNMGGAYHDLSIAKQSIGATFIADMLFDEPWLAPYVGANVYTMNISEEREATTTTPGKSDSVITGFGQQYTLGLLIQLNGADPDAARTALYQYGLENSYLDLFMTSYMATSGADDPNTETSFRLGAGIRFEF